jgi:hypothetical protein
MNFFFKYALVYLPVRNLIIHIHHYVAEYRSYFSVSR